MKTYVWNQHSTPITVAPNGDWRIRLTTIQQDVVFSASQRRELIRAIMRLFADWVVNGRIYRVDHHDDPPWDQSGEAVEVPSSEAERLAWCPTMAVWMERVLTGSSTPTYLAGRGLAHDTYADEIDQLVLDWVAGVLEPQVPADCRAAVIYDDDFAEAVCAFHDAVVSQAGRVSAAEAYKRFGRHARQARSTHLTEGDGQRPLADVRRERATRFWATHMPVLLQERRIDEGTWERLNLSARLRTALADADPSDVEALATAGLPGCPCTPAVTAAVRAIAAEVHGEDRDLPFDSGAWDTATL